MPPRRLVLVRHAKSSWTNTALSDHSRPLNKRGARTAAPVGAALVARGWAPDVVVCSNATRTLQTWGLMEHEVPGPVIFLPDPALYMGGVRQIRDAVRRLDDRFHTAWLFGHNPGWEDAAETLGGFDAPMKTADAVLLQSPAESWSEAIQPNRDWILVDHQVARDIVP